MRCLSYAEGQPESIVHDIDNMVRSYVDKVSYTISVDNIFFSLKTGSEYFMQIIFSP